MPFSAVSVLFRFDFNHRFAKFTKKFQKTLNGWKNKLSEIELIQCLRMGCTLKAKLFAIHLSANNRRQWFVGRWCRMPLFFEHWSKRLKELLAAFVKYYFPMDENAGMFACRWSTDTVEGYNGFLWALLNKSRFFPVHFTERVMLATMYWNARVIAQSATLSAEMRSLATSDRDHLTVDGIQRLLCAELSIPGAENHGASLDVLIADMIQHARECSWQ